MNITEHIAAKGISRADICAKAQISRGMLSLIESGQRRIGIEKLTAFADALGLPVASIRPDLAEVFSTAETQEGAAP